MTTYALKQDSYLLEDCDFSAPSICKLAKNEPFSINEEIGVWKNVTTTDSNVTGWVYTYTPYGDNLMQETYKTGSLGIRIGDSININTELSYARDYYKNTLMVRDKDGTQLSFIVKDIILDPNRVKILANNKPYWFTLDKVTKIDYGNNDNPYGIMLMAENSTSSDSSNKTDSSSSSKTDSNKVKSTTSALSNILNWDISIDIPVLNKLLNTDEKELQDITNTTLTGLRTSNLKGIMGCPYQFMPIADMRIGNDDNNAGNVKEDSRLGVKYAEKIVTKMPMLMMVPGVPQFMTGYSEEDKAKVMKDLASGLVSRSSDLDKIMNQSGRYYDLYPAWAAYYQYVNPLCQMAAVMMGLGEVDASGITTSNDSTRLKNFRWENACADAVKNTYNFKGGCAFYVNSETQVSESLSSDTTQSAVASKVNAISDQARELIFLTSASLKNQINVDLNGVLSSTRSNPNDSVMSGILTGMGNVLTGGKMMFPELWSDSAFSRDYNINIKLISPDADKLSLYMNIVVPLIHLLGLAAPRSLGTTAYTSPFLVRAYYRGFFNINMGIITSMSINKGGEGFWTYEGIPTEVEVSFTIKDLYNIMMLTITNGSTGNAVKEDNDGIITMKNLFTVGGLDVVTNTVLMDYLCNLCGININEPDLERTIALYRTIFFGQSLGWWANTTNRLTQWINEKQLGIYNYFGRGGWWKQS